MNDKIGLVPLLYDEINYGGVLQFYALQKVISNLGFRAEIIYVDDNKKFMQKYKSEPLIKKIARFFLQPYIKYKNNKKLELLEPYIKDRKLKTKQFKEKYYTITRQYNADTISEYKAVICGSDQIWNPNNARKRLFLDFVPDSINKIIYAASLGCESLNSKQKKAFVINTNKIKHISVREKSAQDILRDCLARDDIELVADPTLLLSPDEWNEIIPYNQTNSNIYFEFEYIFVYMLGKITDQCAEIIKDYANKHNKKIIRISFASGETIDTNSLGDYQLNDQGPYDFLAFIKYASCVFTDSFHACVFSIMFRKHFYVFPRDGKTDMLDRIITLLDSFQLPKEAIIRNGVFNDVDYDYTNVEVLHNRIIKKSEDFIASSINEG